MKTTHRIMVVLAVVFTLSAFGVGKLWANGGPFLLKYPNGDPAAKGVLARLDADLRPGRETRLRVIKEDLKIQFGKDWRSNAAGPPLVEVIAEYTIENPTKSEIEVDFGFPILRGIYISPASMLPRPNVHVLLDGMHIRSTIISNSAIYGLIRERACEVIEKAVAENRVLSNLVMYLRAAKPETRETAREALFSHLADNMRWSERDAALMVEYASLDFAKPKSHPPDRNRMGWIHVADRELELVNNNLGALAAIGEQKATQFFAQLACCFDAQAAAAYESIFTAWGGDVRERSVDLETGGIRPREVTVDAEQLDKSAELHMVDPTIYARVDYLDGAAKITESEKASCKAILKHLPVIFTFAPMNILHYRVKFGAKSTHVLAVNYSQYAYSDTRAPASYQLSYVLHPASLWQDFGPINLEVAVPQGVRFRASVPCYHNGIEGREIGLHHSEKLPYEIYRAHVEDKTGELYVAIGTNSWQQRVEQPTAKKPPVWSTSAARVSRQGGSNKWTSR